MKQLSFSDYAKDIEKWKPVINYEGWYEVSSFGRVKRVRKGASTRSGHILKGVPHKQGYRLIDLCKGDGGKRFQVHRLVAVVFLGPCPPGKEVNHKNGIKNDNRVKNLEYVTHSENVKHAFKKGFMKPMRGEHHPRSKLTENDIRKIRELRKKGVYQRDIAKIFNVSHGNIAWIDSGGTWAHVQ